MSESFAELFLQSHAMTKMRPGTIIKGTVVDINDNVVVVNAGLKSEGIIPKEQFYDHKKQTLEVKLGDEVDVALDYIEDGYGKTRLSREKAKWFMAWDMLEKAREQDQAVEGTITDRVKGGFTVDVEGIRAFLPGSLINVRPVKDPSYLEGKLLDFKIVKIDRERNNVVISRRAIMENENSAERQKIFENIKEGDIISGVVKNLTDYGAFIDMGGVDGLLHITDMSWKRIRNASDVVNLGDEIDVKVLKFDRERNRLSLGLKQIGEDPWVNLDDAYIKGHKTGTVTNIEEYGCFVQLEEGIEGLVHVSEMDWANKNLHPSRMVSEGDQVEVAILEVDRERRRISLSMKQCKTNPWESYAANYKKNDQVTGLIKSITDFGIFVGLPEGIDGLIHLSDISWAGDGETLIHKYSKGEEIKAAILAIDAENERISLGIKQLEKDPFSIYINENAKGSVVNAVVFEVSEKYVLVDLATGVKGQIRATELSLDEEVTDARTKVKEDDAIEAKITALDRKKRTINLSVKAKDIEEEQVALKKYTSNEVDSEKLGDVIKDKLDSEG